MKNKESVGGDVTPKNDANTLLQPGQERTKELIRSSSEDCKSSVSVTRGQPVSASDAASDDSSRSSASEEQRATDRECIVVHESSVTTTYKVQMSICARTRGLEVPLGEFHHYQSLVRDTEY